jgi:Txe/YoeB family toxin of Txe-Axe toxin-antitoxin module
MSLNQPEVSYMVSIRKEDVIIPLDVPKAMREQFVKNYFEITKIVKPLSFAGDQKVEHLNDDFYGDWSTLDKLTTKNNINDDFYDDWSTLIKIPLMTTLK